MKKNTRQILLELFAIDSISALGFRAFLWFVISLFIIRMNAYIDIKPENGQNLKAILGYIFLFIFISTAYVYSVYGFVSMKIF